MSGFVRMAVAFGAALMMSMSPVLATDLGTFQTSDRKMDFAVATCDGDNLCVTLLAARGSAATKHIKPWIGKLIVKNAKPAGNNVWRGKVRFGQHELVGALTLRPGKSFKMEGCAYFVICDDITLIPAR